MIQSKFFVLLVVATSSVALADVDMTAAESASAASGFSAINSSDSLTGNGSDGLSLGLGLDPVLVPGAILNVSREVDENPDATDENERFIVKDRMEVGVKLGAGILVGGELSYRHVYTLVYPRKSNKDALGAVSAVRSLLLPYSVAVGKLPAKHVVIVESYVEGAGVIGAGGGLLIPIGLKGSASRVYLNRTIVSTVDGGKLRLFKDTSTYNELAEKVYAQLLIARLPFTVAYDQSGKVHRKAYVLDRTALAGTDAGRAVDLAVAKGNFTRLPGYARAEEVTSKFRETLSRWSVLGLISSRNQFRRDEMRAGDGRDAKASYELQLQGARSFGWSFLGNSESTSTQVTLVGRVDPANGTLPDPAIRMNYVLTDSKTHTVELQKGYLEFANDVADDSRFLDFSPADRKAPEGRDLWGSLNTLVTVVYGRAAIQSLLSLDENRYWAEYSRSDRGAKVELSARRRVHAVFASLADAKRVGAATPAAMTRLVRALKGIVAPRYGAAGGLDGKELGILNRLIGTKKVFVSALITAPVDKESKLPRGVPFTNRRGPMPSERVSGTVFGQSAPLEIYRSF